MKSKFDNVLEMIGNTPVLKINNIDTGKCDLYVKMESLNPFGSIKDRVGLKMIEDAESQGLLKEGSTIIESTAGNTGLGLALAAKLKGYKLILVIPDKMSEEKIMHLEAMGVEIIMTRSDVENGHPEHYQSIAENLLKPHRTLFLLINLKMNQIQKSILKPLDLRFGNKWKEI